MMPMMNSTDPMDMNMRHMGMMLAGQTGAALERAFLEGMIPHHQGAIEMAKYLTGSIRPELIKMGQDIITAQNAEIAQMQKWLIEWGYASTGSVNSSTGSSMDDAMREHCQTMPNMMGCEKYR
jgi:uncharacterized protein (DUF305 family)